VLYDSPGRALVGRRKAGCNTRTAGVYSDSTDTRQSPAATRWVMAEDIGGCGRSAGVEDRRVWKIGGCGGLAGVGVGKKFVYIYT
jgi:hypothetical protein